jgi:hypothetical protein
MLAERGDGAQEDRALFKTRPARDLLLIPVPDLDALALRLRLDRRALSLLSRYAELLLRARVVLTRG